MDIRKRWGLAAALSMLGAVSLAVFIWLQSQSAVDFATTQYAEGSLVRVSVRPLALTPPLFQPFPAQPAYTSAIVFDGDLWLSGQGGLFRQDLETGELLSQWTLGAELPPAPVTALAIGRVGGSGETHLLAATAGGGLLSVSAAGEIFQVLPEEPVLADLTAVLPLSTGGVLLGTQQAGILIWDGQRMRRYHDQLSHQNVTALAGDEGDLWIGTLDDGVLHWSGGALTLFGEEDGLPDRRVLSLAYRPDNVYVGTPLGVAYFRDNQFARSLADGFFAAALHESNRSLLIGTLDEGVVEVPLAEQRTPRPPGPRSAAPGPNEVRAFVSSGPTTLAVARDQVYTRSANGSTWSPINQETTLGLRDRNISALHVDSSHRLWVGYFDRGLDVLDANFARVAELENDQLFCINRIKAAPGQQVTAVATANGFAYFDAAARMRQFLTRDDELISSHVTDMVFTPNTTVLATPAGLTFLDSNGSHSLYAFHGLVNNHVYTLGASGSEVLVGTLGGLSRLQAGQVTKSFTTANSPLTHNWVSAISAWEGQWFIGLYGGGVMRLSSDDTWTAYPELSGIEINPNAMISSASRVYAGTLDRGLLVYDPSEDSWSFITEGLPSKNVTALALADDILYVGSDNGLSRVNEAELTGR